MSATSPACAATSTWAQPPCYSARPAGWRSWPCCLATRSPRVRCCYSLRRDRELSYVVTVMGTLLLAPLLWDHYLTNLLVPAAFLAARGRPWAPGPAVVGWLPQLLVVQPGADGYGRRRCCPSWPWPLAAAFRGPISGERGRPVPGPRRDRRATDSQPDVIASSQPAAAAALPAPPRQHRARRAPTGRCPSRSARSGSHRKHRLAAPSLRCAPRNRQSIGKRMKNMCTPLVPGR